MDASKVPGTKTGRPVSRPASSNNKSAGGSVQTKAADPVQIIKTDKGAKKGAAPGEKDRSGAKLPAAEKKSGPGTTKAVGLKEKSKDKKGSKSEFKKKRKKGFVERFLAIFGIGFGDVKLRDPRALEAVQALHLQPWHLRKLKFKFDKIDIDGSGE